MSKPLGEYTREEFLAIQNFGIDSVFTGLIIVPTDELHESGFRCMKFILEHDGEIVGAASGWSDVVHPNGIGNYGWNVRRSLSRGAVPNMSLSIDCLAMSGCVRLMVRPSRIRDDGIYSDFIFYLEGED